MRKANSSRQIRRKFGNIAEVPRRRLAAVLRSRHALRFHIFVLLLWSFSAGLLTTKALLALGVQSMFYRYTLAIVVAYGAFLVGVRIWLWYVGVYDGQRAKKSDNSSSADVALDVPNLSSRGSSPGSGGTFEGGGGSHGGGGASGSFDDGGFTQPNSLVSEAARSRGYDGGGDTGVSSDIGGSIGDAIGDVGGGDEGCLIVVVVIALLALIAFAVGGAFFLVAMGPEVLIDAAFSALLAGGLIRSSNRVTDSNWFGSVLSATWIPFAATLAGVWIFVLVSHKYAPGTHTFGEAWQILWPLFTQSM